MSNFASEWFPTLAPRASRATPRRSGLLHVACCCPQTNKYWGVSHQPRLLSNGRFRPARLVAYLRSPHPWDYWSTGGETSSRQRLFVRAASAIRIAMLRERPWRTRSRLWLIGG